MAHKDEQKGVFPTVDQRFSRFAGYRQESTEYATLAFGHAGKPKVLWYDQALLVKRGAIITAFRAKGTIFTMDASIPVIILIYICIAAAAFCGVRYASKMEFETDKLEKVSDYLNRFIPFILGLYVTLSVERWWALRTEGIGKVLDAAQNIAFSTATLLPGPDFAPYEDQLLKYALSSVSLIVNMCRGGASIDVLGPKRDNLLTAEEVEILSTIPYRAQATVMWTWILLVATKVMEEHAIPPSKQRDINAEVIKARDGIEKIMTYMQSQLPFAYVHLVTLLVNLNNIIMALKCGVVAAGQAQEGNYLYAGSQLIFLVVVPLLYQGLLTVAFIIADPFGEDLLDFPIMAYQEYANEASVAITHFTHQCPALAKKWAPPPSASRLALIRGAGKHAASLLAANAFGMPAAPSVPSANTEPATKEARQRVRLKEEQAALMAQMRLQDELISSLRKQNQVASSHLQEMTNKVQTLEGRFLFLPVVS